jgi:hypothetical protein
MNPSFDPATVEEIRKRDPDTAAREFDAQWLDASTSLLTGAQVDRCTRQGPAELPYEGGHTYYAFMDPATRGNAWTLIVATRKRTPSGFSTVVVLARQWVGSKTSPLSPKAVLSEIATLCGAYGITFARTDQYAADALRDIAYGFNFSLVIDTVDGAKRNDLFQTLATAFADGTVEIPPAPVVRSDLLSIKKVATQNAVVFKLPVTANGRHCDFVPPLAMAVSRRMPDPEELTAEQAKRRAAQMQVERHWDPAAMYPLERATFERIAEQEEAERERWTAWR